MEVLDKIFPGKPKDNEMEIAKGGILLGVAGEIVMEDPNPRKVGEDVRLSVPMVQRYRAMVNIEGCYAGPSGPSKTKMGAITELSSFLREQAEKFMNLADTLNVAYGVRVIQLK